MPQDTGIQIHKEEQEKRYVVRQKICYGMIFCFVTALVIIAIISIFFFTGFMGNVLTMSVENLFFAHTHSILNDII